MLLNAHRVLVHELILVKIKFFLRTNLGRLIVRLIAAGAFDSSISTQKVSCPVILCYTKSVTSKTETGSSQLRYEPRWGTVNGRWPLLLGNAMLYKNLLCMLEQCGFSS